MREALKILGFEETYHMSCAMENPKDNKMWLEAIDAKSRGEKGFGREEWDQLLGHCQAVTDFPAVLFAPELIAAYPEAKVILTNRDVDEWYEDVSQTLEWKYRSRKHYFLTIFDSYNPLYTRMFFHMWKLFTNSNFSANGKSLYQEHYHLIRKLVPADQLLEYSIHSGWEPLCRFLEVEEPEDAFPLDQEGEEAVKKFRQAVKKQNKSMTWRAVLYILFMALLNFLLGKLFDRIPRPW